MRILCLFLLFATFSREIYAKIIPYEYEQASFFYNNQEYKKCIFFLNSIPPIKITSYKIPLLLGNCLLKFGNKMAALQEYKQSLKLSQEQPNLWLFIADYYYELSFYFESIPFYQKWLLYYQTKNNKIDKKIDSIRYKLIISLFYEKKNKEAKQELEQLNRSQKVKDCEEVKNWFRCLQENLIYSSYDPKKMLKSIRMLKNRIPFKSKNNHLALNLMKEYTFTLYLFHEKNKYKWPYFFYLYENKKYMNAKKVLHEIKKNQNKKEKKLILYMEDIISKSIISNN